MKMKNILGAIFIFFMVDVMADTSTSSREKLAAEGRASRVEMPSLDAYLNEPEPEVEINSHKFEIPKAKLKEPDVETLSPVRTDSIVTQEVLDQLPRLQYLYKKYRYKNPKLRPFFDLSIEINSRGRVSKAHILNPPNMHPELKRELVKKIKQWSFSPVKEEKPYYRRLRNLNMNRRAELVLGR